MLPFCFYADSKFSCDFSASPRAYMHSLIHRSLSPPSYLRIGPRDWKILRKTPSEHLLNQKLSCFTEKSEACSVMAKGAEAWSNGLQGLQGAPC